MKKKLLYSFLLMMLIVACGNPDRLFDEVQKISKDEWQSSDTRKFTVSINDTNSAYDIFLHIRNKSSYEYSNLWLFIQTSAPNNESIRDTVEFILAEPDGKWLGKGLGSINTLLIPYKLNVRFPYRGIYIFEIKQAMRKDVLEGIMDIGMRIQPHH